MLARGDVNDYDGRKLERKFGVAELRHEVISKKLLR
jgi:hypothetical protein